MEERKFKSINKYGNVSVVENYAHQWAVIDHKGDIIVPFGKYGWIDGFDSGLARVRTPKDPVIANNVTSIIIDLFCDDTKVISGKEDIRNYYAKDKRKNPNKYAKWGIINEKGEEVLPVIYDNIWNFLGKNRFSTKIVKDGIETDVYFHDLNPSLPVRGIKKSSYYYEDGQEYNPAYDYDKSDTWYAMTDGMYGDYPEEGFDGDYSFMGY